MKTYEVLEKALALIEDESRWWSGSYCNADSDRFCALGAINVALGLPPVDEQDPIAKTHRVSFCKFAKQATGQMAAEFNDRHSHAEVVALFKHAIRNEKAKAGVPVDLPAPVAQMAEPAICNREGAGSIPAGGLMFGGGEG